MSELTLPTAPLVHLAQVYLNLESLAGSVNVLRGINLELKHGETLAVTGASGSGKSTLLAVIAGLERATSGHVEVAQQNLAELGEDALALFRRRTLGIVFQSFHLIPTMTALENVAVPLELASNNDALDIARKALEDAGLSERSNHYPSQLSGGEQQRVAVARAFANDPALVLADEPTGNLDNVTGALIVDQMFEAQERAGSTLLLITHNESLAGRCQRHFRMDDGVIAPIHTEPSA